jgi:site-specific DNA recombinase
VLQKEYGQQGATHLLQGLVVCSRCGHAYCGTSPQVFSSKKTGATCSRAYYRCCSAYFYYLDGSSKYCNNKSIHIEALDTAVWEEVKILLNDPNRLINEYRRRMEGLEKSPKDQTSEFLEKQQNKIKRSISRFIDSYTQEHIDKEEFEPRIKILKQNLKAIEEQNKKLKDQNNLKKERERPLIHTYS